MRAKSLWMPKLAVLAAILHGVNVVHAAAQVQVVVGRQAPALEKYAADQLCGYLHKLYNIQTQPVTSVPGQADALFLVGSPTTNTAVKQALRGKPFPKLSEQGIVLRRTQMGKTPALIVGGGSPRATLWAVYELVERCGVRYLLHGDVLPENPGEFRLPDLDVVMEPKLTVRQWRVVNDFANGPESWGMRDYRPVIDQLAKLRFNRLLISTYPWQPFLDYKIRGIRRQSATLWYKYRFPITDDMVGKELYGGAKEFWNPDLPLNASYEEFAAAGERLIRNIIDYGHQRGMESVITAHPLEFNPEFAPLLKNPQKLHQLGELDIVPGPDTPLDDPMLAEMSVAVLRAVVNKYPEIDYIFLGVPEHRQWMEEYERAFQSLDRKYGIGKIRSLADALQAASQRTGYPGGAERAVAEVKGDLVTLYYYDRLLTDRAALKATKRPDMKFQFANFAEELFPFLSHVLPPGSEILNFVDYTPDRVVKRRAVLKEIPCQLLPCSLIYTLEDDNVGILPQLTVGNLHELTKDIRTYGWAGYSTRYWSIGGHDPTVTYIARAAWDATTTPEGVFRDQVSAACGAACVEDVFEMFREVQAATVTLEWHALGLAFPVPGMMMKHWRAGPMSAEYAQARQNYRRALASARRAQQKALPNRREYVDFWVGWLEYGVGYFDAIEAVHEAATFETENDRLRARYHAARAVNLLRSALQSYARVARDQSDRGAIAVLNEFAYRPLMAKLTELEM